VFIPVSIFKLWMMALYLTATVRGSSTLGAGVSLIRGKALIRISAMQKKTHSIPKQKLDTIESYTAFA
jgi:hypothetical protein